MNKPTVNARTGWRRYALPDYGPMVEGISPSRVRHEPGNASRANEPGRPADASDETALDLAKRFACPKSF